MVPSSLGYEPAYRRSDSGEKGWMSSNESPSRRFGTLNEKYESTYSRNRRLVSYEMSDIGSHIDVYA